MKRKTKSKSHHMSIRVPADLAGVVIEIARRTGWSDSRSLVWLANVGRRLFEGNPLTTHQARNELDAWTAKREIEVKADRMKREAAAAVRDIVAGKPPRPRPAARKPAAKTPAA